MGRHSGYIALGPAYGQPDIILVPEVPLDIDRSSSASKQLYDLQKNVVIVCGEGIVDEHGHELGAETKSHRSAGNVVLSGAAEALRQRLISELGDRYFQHIAAANRRASAHLHQKVGHTQRGGRPILFDRFYAARSAAKAVDLLVEGRRQRRVDPAVELAEAGFHVEGRRATPSATAGA